MPQDPKKVKTSETPPEVTCDVPAPVPAASEQDSQDHTADLTGDFQANPPAPALGNEIQGDTEVLATCDFRPDRPVMPVSGDETPDDAGAGMTSEFQPLAKVTLQKPDFSPTATSSRTGENAGTDTRDRRAAQPILEATGEYHLDTGAIPGEATGAYVPAATGAPMLDTSLRATTSQRPGGATRSASAGAYFPAGSPKGTSRYFLKKFHAKGGMGEIWLAEDTDLGRQVALKRMLRGKQKDQFLHEAQVTGQLEHPGVIPVHELSLDENGEPFYIMKFVHGQTLKEVIAEYHSAKADVGTPREVQWQRLLNIFLGLCQTVAYAHSRGVIHRDIKPDNVMVGAYGETLVLDWGLAKLVGQPEKSDTFAAIRLHQSEDTMATMAGSIKGSPFYFAPEVAAGRVDEVDQISDVYLLGGTLYQILTGRTPREARKIAQLIELAKTTAPEPPRKRDPTIPKPLEAICLKALALRKQDRYQSAAALAEDLQRYLADQPVTAYRESLAERAWRWVKRHRVGLSRTAAGLIFAGMTLTAFFLIRDAESRRAEAQRVATELQSQNQARQEINTFRELAEEARFFAANSGAALDDAPSMDPAKAELKAQAAVALAGRWGQDLQEMPLEDQRPELRKELYDLLLEMSQLKIRRPEIDSARAAKAILERAAILETPTRSLYRLRAQCLESLGQAEQAKMDRQRVQDPDTPTTALDHYLVGELYRAASQTGATGPDRKQQQGGAKGTETRAELLTKAMDSYREALRHNANHYWSHFQLGKCYMGLGEDAQAVEAMGTCIALRPNTSWGYSSRALALSRLPNRSAEAMRDLDHALRLDPGFGPARLHRGIVLWKQERFAEAEADFAAVLTPADEKRVIGAFFARGQMYLAAHFYEKARADFDQAVAHKLENRTLYLHRARTYLAIEESEKCLTDLTTYLTMGKALDPESAEVYELRGRELHRLVAELPKNARNRRENTYFLALSQLGKALQLGGQTPSLYLEIGIVEENLAGLRPKDALSHVQQAIAAYSKGLEKHPDEVLLQVARGWAHVKLDQNMKGKKDFEAAVKLDPRHGEAYAGLGYTAAVLKSAADARRHASQALLWGGGDYLVLHNVACIYAVLAKTDPPRAAEYYDVALAHLNRGVELWKKGGRNGPDAIDAIRDESAFPPELRKRPEFQELIGGQ